MYYQERNHIRKSKQLLEKYIYQKCKKIALRVNNDKIIQTCGGIISFPYGIDPEIKYKE